MSYQITAIPLRLCLRTRIPRQLTFLVVVAFMAVSGCAGSARLDQTTAFADAAIAFQQQVPTVTSAASDVMIEANNLSLTTSRDLILSGQQNAALSQSDEKRLREDINDANRSFREIQQSIITFNRMSALLGLFFTDLRAYASLDAATPISEATNTTVGQIHTASQAVLGKGVIPPKKDAEVTSIINAGTAFVVTEIQAAGLRRLLEKHGQTINDSLIAQEAFLAALAKWVQQDSNLILETRLRRSVVDPYVTSKPLPANWATNRSTAIKATVDLDNIRDAQAAALQVRTAFQALGENRLDAAHVQAILDQLARIATVLEGIKSLQQGANTNE